MRAGGLPALSKGRPSSLWEVQVSTKPSVLAPFAVQVRIAHLVHDNQAGDEGTQHGEVPRGTGHRGGEPEGAHAQHQAGTAQQVAHQP